MGSKARYRQAMERLYLACIVVSGMALVVITLVIPYGVFMRYVVQSPASWPEPLAILLMVVFTFVGGAAVYRAKQHIAVVALLNAVSPARRRAMLLLVDICLTATCAFMVFYGAQLVKATWHQVIAEFPGLSVGITYLPVPIGGFLTLLFILEHVWAGEPPPTSIMYSDAPAELE
jgi:TRAP-type C4-dicarboxylate transport system permease small subunit